MKDMYIPGDPYFICDICGWKIRHSQMMRTWDGFIVCPKDYDPKHEQLYKTPVYTDEGRSLPNSRPERPDRFLEDNEITEDSF